MRSDVSQVADTDDVSLLVSGTCPVVEHVCATLQAHWDAGDVSFSDRWRCSFSALWRSFTFYAQAGTTDEHQLWSVVMNAEEWTHERIRIICAG